MDIVTVKNSTPFQYLLLVLAILALGAVLVVIVRSGSAPVTIEEEAAQTPQVASQSPERHDLATTTDTVLPAAFVLAPEADIIERYELVYPGGEKQTSILYKVSDTVPETFAQFSDRLRGAWAVMSSSSDETIASLYALYMEQALSLVITREAGATSTLVSVSILE